MPDKLKIEIEVDLRPIADQAGPLADAFHRVGKAFEDLGAACANYPKEPSRFQRSWAFIRAVYAHADWQEIAVIGMWFAMATLLLLSCSWSI
jgi:hypothetical protein